LELVKQGTSNFVCCLHRTF